MKKDFCECVGLPSSTEIEDDKCLSCGKQFESNHFQEAKIINFQAKVLEMYYKKAEIRFRHLSDHLDENPCHGCINEDSQFCFNECKSNKNR